MPSNTINSTPVPPSRERRGELKQTFHYCDENKDGRIQYSEFVSLLDQLEAGMSEQDCLIGFREVDTDHDGSIDFDEFLAWWTE